jgi:hypothetical protein
MSIIQWCQAHDNIYIPIRHESVEKISMLLYCHTHFSPEDPIELMYHGYYYDSIHETDKAMKCINESIKQGNNYAHVFLLHKLFKAGEHDKVEEYYVKINKFVLADPLMSAHYAYYKYQDTKHRDLMVAEIYAANSWSRGCLYAQKVLKLIEKYLYHEYQRVAIMCHNDIATGTINMYKIGITQTGFQYSTSIGCLICMMAHMQKYANDLYLNGEPEYMTLYHKFMKQYTTPLPELPHNDQMSPVPSL